MTLRNTFFKKNKLNVFIPTNINLIQGRVTISETSNNLFNFLYLNSSGYFITLFLKNDCMTFDKESNTLTIVLINNVNVKFIEQLNSNLIKILKSICVYFYKKIKFAGKSYKIEKLEFNHNGLVLKKNTPLIFNFKFSYSKFKKIIIILFDIKSQHIKKNKIYFYTSNITILKKLMYKIIKLRSWDKYTQRGLRLNRQIIYRGEGKKSSYT